MSRYPLLLLFLSIFSLSCAPLEPDIVVFSYNRPLQLEAFLESLYKYTTGFGMLSVIFRCDKAYQKSYWQVAQRYKQAFFIKQSVANPRGDFKALTLKAVFGSPSAYMLFAVDDLIFKDQVDFMNCTRALEKTQAYAFYLRLGKNITHCLTLNNLYTGLPTLSILKEDLYSWQFKTGRGDWCYPHSLDGTIFLKKSIEYCLKSLEYHSPNTLEGAWSAYANTQGYGLCYRNSKVVNLVLNLVQKDFMNKEIAALYQNKNGADIAYLLKKFNQGYKLALEPLHKINNKAPHIGNYQIKLILRKDTSY